MIDNVFWTFDIAMKYRYTKNGCALTEEQREFYEKNGYILIKNNVNHELLDKCRQRFLDICDNKVDAGNMIVMKDASLKNKGVKGEYLINKIQDFLFDEVLFSYCTHKPLVDVVENIIGPNITAAHSMLINKPPDSNPNASLHPIHQDLYYFPFRPAENIVASWTAMERIDQNNGCLYVIPGSHKGSLENHQYPDNYKNKLYHGVQGYDHLPKTYVIMEKGDTVFFHPVLLHGSGPNHTKGFRKAISCHFADSNCHFIDVKGTIQESIAVEAEGVLAKKGLRISYVKLWKFKSRLVKGNPGNFQNVTSNL